MNKPVARMFTVFVLFTASLISVLFVGGYVGYVLFLAFVILLPLLVLTSKDTLHHLNSTSVGSPGMRFVARLSASLPSAAFGLLSLLLGIAIILWVLYNYLVERQPQFTGGALFAGFGIGPALIYFGYTTLRALAGKGENA